MQSKFACNMMPSDCVSIFTVTAVIPLVVVKVRWGLLNEVGGEVVKSGVPCMPPLRWLGWARQVFCPPPVWS